MKDRSYFSKRQSLFSGFSCHIVSEKDKKFDKEFNNYRKNLVSFLIIATWLFNMFTWNLNPYLIENNYTMALIVGQVVFSLFLATLFYFQRKFESKSKMFLIFLVLLNTTIHIEIAKLRAYPLVSMSFLVSGYIVIWNIYFLLLGKINWRTSTVCAVLIYLHLILRIPNRETLELFRFYPLTVLLLSIILIGFGSYYMERKDRETFSDREKYKNYLNQFKELIKEEFPCSIIITNGKQINFANDRAALDLNFQNCEAKLSHLKKIIVEEKNPKLSDDFLYKSYEQRGRLSPLIEEKSLNLKKIIEGLTNSFIRPATNSCYYFGVMKDRSDLNQDLEVYYNIKIKKTVWEDCNSYAIIIAEDNLVQRLNFLKEQARYKDRLLATVSHDLRTPLNGIIGLLDSVIDNMTDKEIKKSIRIALRSSNLLLFLINDIIDFSKISTEQLRLNIIEFPLDQVVKDVTKLIKFQAERKNIKFEFENRATSVSLFRSDPNRLKQVLLNLLSNSLKFTEKGFIKIIIEIIGSASENLASESFASFKSVKALGSLGRQGQEIPKNKIPKKKPSKKGFDTKGSSTIRIRVLDSGCGMNKEEISKLFRLFAKLENSDYGKINQTGIGLGLVISQNLVKLLNGNKDGEDIKVISQPGEGSEFYFNLHSSESERPGTQIGVSYAFTSEKHLNKKLDLNDIRHKEADQMSLCNTEEFPHGFSMKIETLNREFQISKKPEQLQKKKYNILIVDDDQINILVLSRYLDNHESYYYQTAFNGLQAVEKIKQAAEKAIYYDIILMDCNMPVMDGFQATQNILELSNQKVIPRILIIATTANASPNDYENCFKVGMVGFLAKPYKKREVLDKLTEIQKMYQI